MENRLKLVVFWLFQMIFLFFVFFYIFEMMSLRSNALDIIGSVDDKSFSLLLSSYLPKDMLFTGAVFVAFALILTIASNYSISLGHKKLGILLLLLSTAFVAFITFVQYKEDKYLDNASTNFSKIYTETFALSSGSDKVILSNAKLYFDKYVSTPTSENKIKFKTAYQTLIYKLKDMRSIKPEQVETYNNILKLHVNYNSQQEKLINAIQYYIIICLIFLAIGRIRFNK